MTFEDLLHRWAWKPIPNCAGRYVLQGAPLAMTPEQVLDGQTEIRGFTTPLARDKVLVAEFEGGGLISYERPDGSYCHTLNTSEGLQRKLEQLGLRNDGSE